MLLKTVFSIKNNDIKKIVPTIKMNIFLLKNPSILLY